MSDLSDLDQSFGLSAATLIAPEDEPRLHQPPLLADIQPHEVSLRRLRGQHEISRVVHLRQQIQLPASAKGDASFAAREKKETRRAWWGDSSAIASTSVPSATSR